MYRVNMSEKEYSEIERELTPAELNNQLKQVIHTFMPKSDDFGDRDSLTPSETKHTIGERMESRTDSEMETALESKLKEVLQKGKISTPFKDFIVQKVKVVFEVGNPHQDEESKLLFFLDTATPDSGGIFDPEKAKVLERKAIARQVIDWNTQREHMKERSGEKVAKLDEALSRRKLDMWKRAFLESYGEPVTDADYENATPSSS
jgi:hypothetical protein